MRLLELSGPAPQRPSEHSTPPKRFNPELSVVHPVGNSTLYSRTFGDDTPLDLIYLASPASLGFQVMLQMGQQPLENQIPIICNFQTDLSGCCSILFPEPLSHMAVFAFDAVQSFLFRHSSIKTIFYPSRFVKRYLVNNNNVPASKLELLTRGVNTELFYPRMRSAQLRKELAPNGEVIFVTVSRIAGEKGFEFLTQAAKELDARGFNFKLYIVGGNRNPDVEKSVQELFDPLSRQGKVVFAGFKIGEDLATAYASGDVFLHCSVTETFGLVVLESMAGGVPVVARDDGGPSDIVQHGDTGFLVPPNDLDGFVNQAIKLAQDVALRRQMSRQARAAACDDTWDKVNNKVAWRTADTIEARQREQLQQKLQQSSTFGSSSSSSSSSLSSSSSSSSSSSIAYPHALIPMYGWLVMNNSFREAMTRRVIDARLLGGLGIIMSCWAGTGCYVLFSEGLMWAKSRTRIEQSKVS
ncbi:hypothetical protein E4U43_001747 [Claviceps pusilla]|uniref:Glycosyl transferase family 1 domain-containing protein n=1 Tax=Claviceps pusilla TaxID=123648 RepID=A0A9P7N9A5_9HYPO|nr:hypothetical protein E4U43_001747 [Claviceps pusilla]